LDNGVKFIVSPTLLLRLPGMEPDAKPELFNFKCEQFTDECGPGICSAVANMPKLRCSFTQAILIAKLLGETIQ
jgi:hypothetical protein